MREPHPAAHRTEHAVSDQIAMAQKRILAFLSVRRSWRRLWRPAHPELLRVWGQIHKEIEDIRRLGEHSSGN